MPAATTGNRGVIWQALARTGSGKGDDFPVSRMNSSGTMVTDSLVAGTLLEHSNTWLATQTFPAVTANGVITGNAAGNIISINSTGNALNLRNQGSGMALYVQGSGGDAGFYNTGALEAQRVYSPASGSAGAGAFQTNNFDIYDPGSAEMDVGHSGTNWTKTNVTGFTVTGGVLHLKPIARPGSATAGDIYVDRGDTHTYEWNGTAWKQLDN